jgi:hypothetical protein
MHFHSIRFSTLDERTMDRIEAACSCDFPEGFCDWSMQARAQWLLDCADPPKGMDYEFCWRVASNITDGFFGYGEN